jgi:hypothetical protein
MVTAMHQAWLSAKSADGRCPSPMFLALRMQFSTRAWAQWRAWRQASCPSRPGMVRGVLVPSAGSASRLLLEQRQLCAGVRALTAGDDPRIDGRAAE